MGYSLVDDHRVVRVEDHQGKEVANEVFSQAWLAAESTVNTEVFWLTLVVIDEVGTEGAIGFSSFEIVLGFT